MPLDLDELVKYSFDNGKRTPLMNKLVECYPPQYIRTFLDMHTDFSFLNRPDPDITLTPLKWVTLYEDELPQAPEIIRVLLDPKYGVDIHARCGPSLYQPIFAAAEVGSTEAFKILLEHGGDLFSTAANQNPPTIPINIAIQKNNIDIVAHIINTVRKQGDRLNQMLNHSRNKNHQTTVQAAMSRQRTEIIGMIARSKGDLRNSFYSVWNEDPFNDDRCTFVDPVPELLPETWPLYKAVYSFISKTCCYCREPVVGNQQNTCSQCTLAWYCDRQCLKKDWKTHKNCCKRLKRGVDLVLGKQREYVRIPILEQTGFKEPYIESKNQLNGIEDFDYDYSWEYHGVDEKDPTKRVWKKYPPLVNFHLEGLCGFRAPRYLYRPNENEAEGYYHNPPPFIQPVPPNKSTRHVYFGCMMEFDVYTGAARAVRRVSSNPPVHPMKTQDLENVIHLMTRLRMSETR